MTEGVRSGYASVDGVHVAYQAGGEGPLDLLIVPDGVIPIEMIDEEPSFARFVRRLESFARVIRFDRRGTGMSDPIAPGDPPTLEQWAEDAEAVLDAVGSERAALLGMAEGGFLAMMLAATSPERCTSLALVHAMAGISAEPFREWGTIALTVERLGGTVGDAWGTVGFGIPRFAPSAVGDERYHSWLVRAARRAMSPAMARALFNLLFGSDVRDVLPAIRIPTLVLHRTGNTYVSRQHAEYLAGRIPDARLVEVEGVDHVPYVGDPTPLLDAIEEFVTGRLQAPVTDRFLATTLFTDIVGSTEIASRLGDAGWLELLRAHHEAVRGELERFGGREIDTAGDGFFALFDGPARAIRCATSILRSVHTLGLEIRAGVHIGECELVDGKPGGIAVNLGARIAGAAGPGEILVSRTVTDLVAGSGIAFDDRGERALKGLSGRWRLFAVVLDPA